MQNKTLYEPPLAEPVTLLTETTILDGSSVRAVRASYTSASNEEEIWD